MAAYPTMAKARPAANSCLKQKCKSTLQNSDLIRTPVGSYALIVTPLRVDGIEAIESVVRDRVREVVGLAGAFYGRNVAYQHLFDNILNFDNDQTSFFGPVMQNPNWFESS